MRTVKIKFVAPDETNLLFLENLCLTLEEMVECYEVKISSSQISKLLKKYNIVHKKAVGRVIYMLQKRPSLLAERDTTLSNYFKVNRRTIIKARKEMEKNGEYNDYIYKKPQKQLV